MCSKIIYQAFSEVKNALKNLEIKNLAWFAKFFDTSQNFNTNLSNSQQFYRSESNSHLFESIGIKFPSIWIDGNRIPINLIYRNLISLQSDRWEFESMGIEFPSPTMITLLFSTNVLNKSTSMVAKASIRYIDLSIEWSRTWTQLGGMKRQTIQQNCEIRHSCSDCVQPTKAITTNPKLQSWSRQWRSHRRGKVWNGSAPLESSSSLRSYTVAPSESSSSSRWESVAEDQTMIVLSKEAEARGFHCSPISR